METPSSNTQPVTAKTRHTCPSTIEAHTAADREVQLVDNEDGGTAQPNAVSHKPVLHDLTLHSRKVKIFLQRSDFSSKGTYAYCSRTVTRR